MQWVQLRCNPAQLANQVKNSEALWIAGGATIAHLPCLSKTTLGGFIISLGAILCSSHVQRIRSMAVAKLTGLHTPSPSPDTTMVACCRSWLTKASQLEIHILQGIVQTVVINGHSDNLSSKNAINHRIFLMCGWVQNFEGHGRIVSLRKLFWETLGPE